MLRIHLLKARICDLFVYFLARFSRELAWIIVVPYYNKGDGRYACQFQPNRSFCLYEIEFLCWVRLFSILYLLVLSHVGIHHNSDFEAEENVNGSLKYLEQIENLIC